MKKIPGKIFHIYFISLKIRINECQLKKILFSLNEDNLPSLTILWLDNIRDPNKYFSKERLTSGAWVDYGSQQ